MLTVLFKNGKTTSDIKAFTEGYRGYKHLAVRIEEVSSWNHTPLTTLNIILNECESNLTVGIHIYVEEVEGEMVVSGQFVNINGNRKSLEEALIRLGIRMISDATKYANAYLYSDPNKCVATGYLEKPSLEEILGFVYRELGKSLKRTLPEEGNEHLKELRDSIFTELFCKTFNITRDLDPEVEESMDDFIMRRSQALNNFHMLKATKIVPETMDFDTFLKRIQSTEVVEDPYDNLVKEFQSLVEKFTNYVPETTLAHLLADVKMFFENTDLNFWILNQNNPKLIQLLVESCKKLELKDENLKNLFKVLGQTVLKNV